MIKEGERLNQASHHSVAQRKWGLYLTERQLGTVREDYSSNSNAWNCFTHDQARSLAGIDASPQTGRTSTVARLIQLFGYWESSDILAEGRKQIIAEEPYMASH